MKTNSLLRKLTRGLMRFWISWRWYIVFVFCVWIPVRSVIADYSPVPTGSMNPTILEGDVVYVNKLAYELRVPLTLRRVATWGDPKRGDIVVVFSPADGERLVKRVIGVPGDVIAMSGDRLSINGKALVYAAPLENYSDMIPSTYRSEAVFAEENLTGVEHAVEILPRMYSDRRSFDPITVPAGKVFVMGDNRDNSRDSRYFGFADRSAVIGRVQAVLVSWDIKDTYLPRMNRFFTALR